MKKLSLAFVFTLLAVTVSFAQTDPVVVAPASPWWTDLANQVITAGVAVVTAAVAALSPFAFQWLRSKSKLAAVLVSQAMLDKLAIGINAQIRAEAEKLKQKLDPKTAKAEALSEAAPVTIAQKEEIVANAQPKIEAAFKETLRHFGKEPGSQAVTDMILGRVDDALAKPAVVVPFPQNKG